MTAEELRAKFDDNAGGILSAPGRDRLYDTVMQLERLGDAAGVVTMTTG